METLILVLALLGADSTEYEPQESFWADSAADPTDNFQDVRIILYREAIAESREEAQTAVWQKILDGLYQTLGSQSEGLSAKGYVVYGSWPLIETWSCDHAEVQLPDGTWKANYSLSGYNRVDVCDPFPPFPPTP